MARGFNGSSDKITTASATYFPGSTVGRSFSVWFYCAVLPAAYAGIFVDSGSSNGPLIYIKSTGALAIYPQAFAQSAASQDPLASSTVSVNTWNNFVLTSDGSSTCVMYLNGTQLKSEGQGNNSAYTTGTFIIGDDPGTSGRFFNGRIADVAMWEALALTAGEVSALAQGARPSKIRPASLAAWWPLNGLASPEPDLSRFARNATLTGTSLAGEPPVNMLTPLWPALVSPAGPITAPYDMTSIGAFVCA